MHVDPCSPPRYGLGGFQEDCHPQNEILNDERIRIPWWRQYGLCVLGLWRNFKVERWQMNSQVYFGASPKCSQITFALGGLVSKNECNFGEGEANLSSFFSIFSHTHSACIQPAMASLNADPPVFQTFESKNRKPLCSLTTRVCLDTGIRYTPWSTIQDTISGIFCLRDWQNKLVLFTIDMEGEL